VVHVQQALIAPLLSTAQMRRSAEPDAQGKRDELHING
jgi:hypothetical protein